MKSLKIFIAILMLAHVSIPQAGTGFRLSESSVNSDFSDWQGLDESQVFYKRFTHQEAGHSWTIKIGKGGQLYSIKLPALGELIAYQRAKHGQWVDEVFQYVLQMPPNKSKSRTGTVVDGDIHQAGYYTQSDLERNRQLLPRSVYSPLFAYQFDSAANSVSYTTWPQHAHLPRRYSENLLLINQTLRDIGKGAVEISVEFNKWGGARNKSFFVPFSAFRTSTVPVQILSNPDGSYREVTQALRATRLMLREGRSGGWIAVVSSHSPSAEGIGIVFGKEPQASDGKRSLVTWGNYGPRGQPRLGGTVVGIHRAVNLDIGETLFYRYYIVLGKLSDIQIEANRLESKVVLKKTTMTPEQAKRLAICQGSSGELKRTCANGEAPLFYTYKDFVPDAKPLFMLQNSDTGRYMVTDNPYEISFDPTDGLTRYLGFLGWSVPEQIAANSCRYQRLNQALALVNPQPQFGRNVSILFVLRLSHAGC